MLKQVAATLKRVLREEDLIYRYGGEEFVLLMRIPVNEHAQRQAAQRLLDSVRDLTITLPNEVTLKATVTIGIASAKVDEELAGLIKRADDAMYRGESSGRDCCVVADQT